MFIFQVINSLDVEQRTSFCWKGLVIPVIKSQLQPQFKVSALLYNLIGIDRELNYVCFVLVQFPRCYYNHLEQLLSFQGGCFSLGRKGYAGAATYQKTNELYGRVWCLLNSRECLGLTTTFPIQTTTSFLGRVCFSLILSNNTTCCSIPVYYRVQLLLPHPIMFHCFISVISRTIFS